jgi:hypothetical protein
MERIKEEKKESKKERKERRRKLPPRNRLCKVSQLGENKGGESYHQDFFLYRSLSINHFHQ